MKKIKDKVKALELLQQRDSNPKITCQWIADQCGYSRKQIERLSAERKEKDTSAILTHGNTGRKPATTASDQEIRYLEELKKTYPSITIAQFRDIYLEDVIRNKDMEADVVKYGLKERSKSWFRELFVREGWKSPADKPIRMDGSASHIQRGLQEHIWENWSRLMELLTTGSMTEETMYCILLWMMPVPECLQDTSCLKNVHADMPV